MSLEFNLVKLIDGRRKVIYTLLKQKFTIAVKFLSG